MLIYFYNFTIYSIVYRQTFTYYTHAYTHIWRSNVSCLSNKIMRGLISSPHSFHFTSYFIFFMWKIYFNKKLFSFSRAGSLKLFIGWPEEKFLYFYFIFWFALLNIWLMNVLESISRHVYFLCTLDSYQILFCIRLSTMVWQFYYFRS